MMVSTIDILAMMRSITGISREQTFTTLSELSLCRITLGFEYVKSRSLMMPADPVSTPLLLMKKDTLVSPNHSFGFLPVFGLQLSILAASYGIVSGIEFCFSKSQHCLCHRSEETKLSCNPR